MLEVFSNLRWQDAVDIGIISFALYWLIHMIKGTRAMQTAIGLVMVLLAYVLSQTLGLFTLEWLLRNFLGSIILVIIVIFQSDIRRVLTQVGTTHFFSGIDRVQRGQILEEIAKAPPGAACPKSRGPEVSAGHYRYLYPLTLTRLRWQGESWMRGWMWSMISAP